MLISGIVLLLDAEQGQITQVIFLADMAW